MSAQTIQAILYQNGLISIIRGAFSPTEMLRISERLLAGGVRSVEITLNSQYALEGISDLQEQFGNELMVGAGTVRTTEDVSKAVNAGASYLVAPSLDLSAVREAQQQNVLLIPGVFTASEAQAAYVAGCNVVKLFPADTLGPAYLKALRAPLNHIDFVPSGGVDHESIAEFHHAGAVAYGVGSALIRNVDITADELTALEKRASLLTQALEVVRNHA